MNDAEVNAAFPQIAQLTDFDLVFITGSIAHYGRMLRAKHNETESGDCLS